jgi:hypothetical protein
LEIDIGIERVKIELVRSEGGWARSLGLAKILAVPRPVGGFFRDTVNFTRAIGFDLFSDRKAGIRTTILAGF